MTQNIIFIILQYVFFSSLIIYSIVSISKTFRNIKTIKGYSKKINITGKHLINLSENTKVLTFDPRKITTSEDRKEFWINYFDLIKYYTLKATKRIIIFDYLDNQKSLEIKGVSESLNTVYQDFFTQLEFLVKEKNIQYTRIIQLPLDSKVRDSKNGLLESMSLMYSQKRIHVNRMIKNENFKLYCLTEPFRTYSFLIIDDNFLLSEYDKYDNKIAHPDTLFVNKNGSEEYNTLITIRINEINAVLNKIVAVSERDFEFVNNNIDKYLVKQRYYLKRQIEETIEHYSRLERFSQKIIDQNLADEVQLIINSTNTIIDTINKKNYNHKANSELIFKLQKSMSSMKNSLEKQRPKHPIPQRSSDDPEQIRAAVAYLGTQVDGINEQNNKISTLNEIKEAKKRGT